MSKLREKFDAIIPLYVACEDSDVDQLEQITDDFSVKLLIWMANLKHENDELKHIDYENSSDEQIATEISKTFKDKYYE